MNPDANHVLAALWHELALPASVLERVTLSGSDPVWPSSFAIGTAAQVSVATAALAAALVGEQRGGPAQRLSVDLLHALVECRSERALRIDGHVPPDPWDPLAGLYRTGDDRWVRLHTNFAHHLHGVLRLLGCEGRREAVADALRGWTALAFEACASDAGLCVAALRSFDEWDAHPQSAAVSSQPLVRLTRLDDAPPRPMAPLQADGRPLQAVRVLDLTRVIAGPVAGRTLAAHGADVLLVTAAHLPAIELLVVDTGRGKRSARVDLREEAGRQTLRGLVRQADVFLQSYRPGALARRGFDPATLARLSPGLVVASLSAYGLEGPWAGRRGFDSLVQAATGLNVAEAEAAGDPKPRALPLQLLDHASGHLLAAGIQAALWRRAQEGGSWHVEVSLAGTSHWLRGMGRVNGGFDVPEPDATVAARFVEQVDSGFGPLTAVRPAAVMDRTPARWTRPAVPLGTDPPRW